MDACSRTLMLQPEVGAEVGAGRTDVQQMMCTMRMHHHPLGAKHIETPSFCHSANLTTHIDEHQEQSRANTEMTQKYSSTGQHDSSMTTLYILGFLQPKHSTTKKTDSIYQYKSQQLNNASKTKTTHASQIVRVP